LASPILRETIKKLKERQALLQKQIKGPLTELQQIEEDLVTLGATGAGRRAATPPSTRAPRGANQAAILRAIRNGATSPAEVAEKTGLSPSSVTGSLTSYIKKQKLVTQGANGLTLTRSGREKLAELEGR
jgi:lambda repressor-like predicted transcriptional regulator